MGPIKNGLLLVISAPIDSLPYLRGGLMKTGICSVHTMYGLLMGVDLVRGFLRPGLKVLKWCTTRFPTMVSRGLHFVWPDENGWERAQATKPPMLPDDFDKPEFSTVTIQRDLFYSYGYRKENSAKPPFKLKASGPWGFAGTNDGKPRISAKFVAPCYYMDKCYLHV